VPCPRRSGREHVSVNTVAAGGACHPVLRKHVPVAQAERMSYTRDMSHWVTIVAVSFRTTDHLLTSGIWWCAIIWLGFFGGAVGSFLTVVWDRLGTGEGFVFPRSRCPECDRPIRWYHNVPVVGWLLLGGRCYDCSSRIPVKHPLVELAFALLFIAIGLATPWL
jgi:hypothetical protein